MASVTQKMVKTYSCYLPNLRLVGLPSASTEDIQGQSELTLVTNRDRGPSQH